MTPLNPVFRRFLRWFIPQLKNEKLDRLDGLLALRHHLIIEKGIGKTPIVPGAVEQQQKEPPPTDIDIEQLTREANAILKPYEKEYEKVLFVWTTRRKLDLQQNQFLPIPTSLSLNDLNLIIPYCLNSGLLLADKLPFVSKVRKFFVSKIYKPSGKK